MRTNFIGLSIRRALAVCLALVMLIATVDGVGAQEVPLDGADTITDPDPAVMSVEDPAVMSVEDPIVVPIEAMAAALDGAGPAIIGGSNANLRDYPYYALVTNPQGTLICGGTLVRKQWILTAAHCVDDLSNRSVYSVFGFSGRDYADAVRSSKVYIHPRYSSRTGANDIALVRLAKTPKLSSPLIGTTSMVFQANQPKIGSRKTVIGHGLTSPNGDPSARLKKVKIRIKSCRGAYGTDNNRDHICGGGRIATACQGDSGGPLLIGNKVAGIVSYGTARCVDGYGVFTRVSAHEAWIKQTLGPRCAGKPVTVNLAKGQKPTSGNDVILGTSGNDVIAGSGGNDIICGRGGNDVLKGGGGRDRLIGGPGRDKCLGGSGKDRSKGCEVVRSASR